MLVWGKRTILRLKGYGADFCPCCRDLRQSKVRELRHVSHLYFVPIGRGRLVGYRLECLECGAPVTTDGVTMSAYDKRPAASLEDSIAATNPGIRSAYAERLAFERELAAGAVPADAEVRKALLYEPFEALLGTMEQELAQSRVDGPAAIGCFGTLVAVMIAGFAGNLVFERFSGDQPTDEVVIFTILGVGLLGLGHTLWQLHRSGNRWFARRMLPPLVRALGPLRPTPAELGEVLATYREHGCRFPRVVRPEDLLAGPVPTPPTAFDPGAPVVPR